MIPPYVAGMGSKGFHHMFELWVNFLMGLGIYWEEFGYEVSEWNGFWTMKCSCYVWTVAVLLFQAGWQPGDLAGGCIDSQVRVFKL